MGKFELVCPCKKHFPINDQGDCFVCSDRDCVHAQPETGFKKIDGTPVIIIVIHYSTPKIFLHI
jgi:hypothetical protein